FGRRSRNRLRRQGDRHDSGTGRTADLLAGQRVREAQFAGTAGTHDLGHGRSPATLVGMRRLYSTWGELTPGGSLTVILLTRVGLDCQIEATRRKDPRHGGSRPALQGDAARV